MNTYTELYRISAQDLGHADPHHVAGTIADALEETDFEVFYDMLTDEYVLVEVNA